MANTLRFKRGLASGLPTGLAGEPLFTTDTFDLYIGNGTTNTRFQKFIASGTTSQLLRGDGSLLTMPIVLSSPANGEVLKYNGTNWVNSSDAGITGSGVAGQVAYFTGATTQGGSNNLFWDASNNRLGIGTNAPSQRLDVKGTAGNGIRLVHSNNTEIGFLYELSGVQGAGLGLKKSDGTQNVLLNAGGDSYINGGNVAIGTASPSAKLDVRGNIYTNATNTNLYLDNGGVGGASLQIGVTGTTSTYINSLDAHPILFLTSNTQRARITATGNFIINNSSTDNGLRFQVTGTSYFSDYVGIGGYNVNVSLTINKNITGSVNAYGIYQNSAIQSDVTSNAFMNRSIPTVAASSTIAFVHHYAAAQSTIGAGSSINTQIGFHAESTLTGATTNYGFYGAIASGTGRWNLYMNGTANNYMAGNLGIGVTVPAGGIDVNNPRSYFRNSGSTGTAIRIISTFTNGRDWGIGGNYVGGNGEFSIYDYTANAERLQINASGNLGLGVTPSAWNSGLKVQQIGYSAFILGSGSEQSILGSNWYQNTSSTNVYLNNGFATFYQQVSGQHQWFTAPSGTAGNAITFTQAMTLDASGNLAVGTSTATQRLTVNGTINVHGGGNSFIFGTSGANTRITGDNSGGTNSYLSIFTNGSNRLHIPEGGNVILGWTGSDTGEKLQVNGTMRVSGDLTGSALIQSTNATYGRLKTISGTRNITIESFSADWNYIRSNGLNFVIGTQDSNTLYFRTNDTDRLTISNTGAATFSSSVTAGGYYYVTPSGSAQLYNIVNSNASFTGSYVFQAGGGSAGFGGSIVAYGHSHATKAGWISSCISASSGGKFSVNNSGLGAGSDVFTVDANGAGVFSSSVTAGSLVSGSTTTNGYLTLSRGVNTTFESAIVFRTSGVGNWIVGNRANSTEDFIFYNGTTATDSLRITATTGAATFSSSVGIGGTPAQRLDVQGSANSIQARFGNVAGRGLTIGTSAISGTNDAGVVFNAPTATDGTLIFQTTSVERARISGSGNLLINTTSDTGYKLRVNGTSYFDDNLRFPNLKGCVFVQTGGTLLGSISMDTANQVTIDNNGFAGLSVGGSYTMTGGNLGIGQGGSAFGSGTRVISVVNGTAPSSSVATSFLMYSANVTTGNAAPHFRTENGGIIKLYQQTTAVTSATYIGGAGTTVTDLDTFDGYTIPQIVKALRNAGLLA